MPSYPKFTVDTITALAVAAVLYKQNNNKVKRFASVDRPGSKEKLFDHFLGQDVVTDIDLDAAAAIKDNIVHCVTMASITGDSIPSFTEKIFKLLGEDTVSSTKFGWVVWAPKLSDDINKQNHIKEQMYRFKLTSNFIDKVGSTVKLTFNVLSCKYLMSYQSWAHTGDDGNGNLITFFCKKEIPSGTKITARVKSHDAKSSHRYTRLHYVKEAK